MKNFRLIYQKTCVPGQYADEVFNEIDNKNFNNLRK